MNVLKRFRPPAEAPLEWNGLRATIADHWPTDAAVVEGWERLAARAEYTFFHTPTWQQAVWAQLHGRGRPAVITICRGQEIVAVLPLESCRRGGFFTPAPHITDYLDPLIAPEGMADICRMCLRAMPSDQSLTLSNIREDAPTWRAWEEAAGAEAWRLERTVTEQCPMLTLPTGVDEWMGSLRPHIRKELKRKIRKVMEKGAGRLEVCPADQAEARIEDMIGLMRHRGQKANDVRRTLGPILRRAAPELIRAGRLCLSTLFVEGRAAACILEASSPDGPRLYNSGFDTTMKPWSPGLVAVALSIIRSIERGEKRYDFLRGEEPYKYDLGARDRPLFRLTLTPPGGGAGR